MARAPMAQDSSVVPSDPYIRDRSSRLSVEPSYIRDSDLESGFVRYPKAGGRLIEKGVGALMEDPLGLVTGAATGIYDFIRESGDPATFAQNLGMSLGLPIVESGERLASGDYEGLTQEEEEEARLLDALTVAELVPLLGLGIKGVTGAMRRRLRAENPGMDDAEIEAIMAQMELEATRPDPGGEDLGPRPAELGMEELPETPLAELDRMRDDSDTTLGGIPMDPIEIEMINASRVEDGEPPLPGEQIIAQEYDEIFGRDTTAFPDDGWVPPEIADDGVLLDGDGNIIRDFESAIEDRLNLELGRYFGDNDQMTISDALVVIGEDVVGGLDDLGYGAAETFTFIDEAMERGGYTPDQRRQLMDELFPPVATEPGQPLDPWRNVADADDIEPVIVQDPYTGDFEELSPNNPYIDYEGPDDLVQAIQWERDNAVTDEGGPTPMNQLEAMDFSMTGNDTALNSRFEEVVLAPGAPKKFKNKQEFVNFLTNNKNGVTNAEIEARGIEGLSDGPIDLDDPRTRAWLFRDPLKVRILEGPDTQYKSYFLPNARNYRETVITLDGSPFDGDMVNGGIVGDSQHFVNTQRSMGGPELLHMRTGVFDVVDPPTTEKGATIAGKTFHVGEIQSQATQNARDIRKSRKLLEKIGNGDVDVGNSLLQGPFARIAKLKGQMKKPQEAGDYQTENRLRIEAIGLRDDIRATQRVGRPTEDLERKLAEVEADLAEYSDDRNAILTAQVETILRDNNLPETFYDDTKQLIRDSELFDDAAFTSRYGYDSFEEEPSFYIGELEGAATAVNVDDLGVGSLYQTDRITNIAVKQALEQAIDSGADFITFNRGDLVHGMTGGKLEGHQEYYDKILPKNVNKLMEKLEKQNKVKLPRLEKLELKTESGPELGRVLGFKLTPELRKVFKEGVQAFKSGGMVEPRNLGLGSMGREVL